MSSRVVALACRLTSRYVTSTSFSLLPHTSAINSNAALLWLGQGPAPLARSGAALHQPGLRRLFSSLDVTKEMDAVNELFVEAREEIEFAKEEAETVYFNESVKTAKKAVEVCLSRWQQLLEALPEGERNRVMRSMGLKISQLQAEFDEVSKLHLED